MSPVGRPRDPQRDAAIVEATVDLLEEHGYGGLSVEAVAARAGVGKATIYRRWPGKQQLVATVLDELSEPWLQTPDGPVEQALCALLAHVGRKTGQMQRVLPRLMAEARNNPELLAGVRDGFIRPRRARLGEVLRQGMQAGELRSDLDVEHAIDLLVGPLVYRGLQVPFFGPVPDDMAERVVRDVLRGLRA